MRAFSASTHVTTPLAAMAGTWDAGPAMHAASSLWTAEHLPDDLDARTPLVVLVHVSLDQSGSFSRVVRRLEDLHTVVYDRRGYRRSREALHGTATLADHIDDLLEVIDGRPAVAVGHSYGGTVVLGAALRRGAPNPIVAVAAYELPLPWVAGTVVAGTGPVDADAAAREVEVFFRRMVGDAAWERLPEPAKQERRDDGPALVADLESLRLPGPPFDATTIDVPLVVGWGERSDDGYRSGVHWLAEHVANATMVEISGAGHGVHLTHPDAFADFVRTAVARAEMPAAQR